MSRNQDPVGSEHFQVGEGLSKVMELKMDFQEADRRFSGLKRQYDNGDLSDDEYRAQLEQLAVQDNEGRWWVKHRDTGAWYYQVGDSWVQGTPYREPDSSEGEPNGEVPGTGSGMSGATRPEESAVTVQETPGWWIPVGIVSAIVSFIIPYVGILLPFVGIYLGYKASQMGKTTGGNVTMIIGAACLLLRFFQLVGGGI
jgi:hypothetical protein